MFSKNKDGDKNKDAKTESAPPLKPFSRNASHGPGASSAPAKPAQPATPEPPRRTPDIPTAVRRIDHPRGLETESKKLTVGRDISLKGEITSCDKLVVEGRVEATMESARVIEVARSGFFKGNVVVEEADISGRFEGELTAKSQLTVRAGGRVSGAIRYGKIVIEAGGEISGDMSSLGSGD
jgi:cytoskeletal protein CcmA (bactofilin family)